MEEKAAVRKQPLTRFGEFELLKALAIVGLPLVHVMEEAVEAKYASAGLIHFGFAIYGLCVFGPSIFMICMGFGLGGNRTSADAIRRNGIQFLLIGALLNIFRWLLPGILSALTIHTPLIEDINYCLVSDIYYFVGIFYIFYSFMKQWKISTGGLILISLLLLTADMLLTPYTNRYLHNHIVRSLVGNIVYVDETSCFPLMSWAIFPSVGILLGEILKKTTEEERAVYMRRMMDFSVVVFICFSVFLWTYKVDLMRVLVSPANAYITDLPNVVLLICIALFVISVMYYLCRVIGASAFMEYMLRVSAFIIPFYLLQWIIIAWIFYLLPIFHVPLGTFNVVLYLGTVVIVTVICLFVSTRYGMKIMKKLLRWTTIKKKKKKKKPVKQN